MARRGATGATGALRSLVPSSLGQRSPSDFRRPAKVGLTLVDRRQRTLGPNPGVRRIPDHRDLARRERGTGVHPSGAGGDGMGGTVWVVEGIGYGRSYPLVPAYGGLLRSHESAADSP